MLTSQAFNALLKTLEEPPSHIIFIFATTEPHKIPLTILSRCQKFDFKRIHPKNNAKRLEEIAKQEKIKISQEAIYEISRLSNGGLRDSIGMLDQAIAYADEEITLQDIHDINGTISKDEVWEIIESILKKEIANVIVKIDECEEAGKSIEKVTQEIIQEFRNLIIYNSVPEMLTEEEKIYAKFQKNIDIREVYKYIYAL
jgi:DNA polymerase-3 subunit gamma/tau